MKRDSFLVSNRFVGTIVALAMMLLVLHFGESRFDMLVVNLAMIVVGLGVQFAVRAWQRWMRSRI